MNKKKLTMLTAVASMAILASGAAIAITSLDKMNVIQAQEKQTTGFKAIYEKETGLLKTQSSDPRYKEITTNTFELMNIYETFQIGGDNGFIIQNLEDISITFDNLVSLENILSLKLNQETYTNDKLTFTENMISINNVNIKQFHELVVEKSSEANIHIQKVELTYSCQ